MGIVLYWRWQTTAQSFAHVQPDKNNNGEWKQNSIFIMSARLHQLKLIKRRGRRPRKKKWKDNEEKEVKIKKDTKWTTKKWVIKQKSPPPKKNKENSIRMLKKHKKEKKKTIKEIKRKSVDN